MPVFRWSFLLPGHWPAWMLVGLLFIISLLPLRVIDNLGTALGKIAARRNKKRFRIAATNISLCFPDKTENEVNAMVVNHFCAQTRSLLHYGMIWWSPTFRLRKRMVMEGNENIENLKKQGKNIIALTCHSVGLEFSVAALTLNHLSSGPYKAMRNEVVNWMVARGRTRFAARVFTREDGLRPLIRDTREGRVLIYLADEDHGAEKSVFAEFFNVQKATVPVLGRLARSCQASVLPVISYYDRKTTRYTIKIFPALENFPTGDDVQDTTTMNKALEQAVLTCPEQYFWTLRFFQTRPPDEPSIYD